MSATTPGDTRSRDSRLDRVVIVLDQTQDLVNIAGVVRGMKNMGLTRLHLANPEEFDAWRITGIAHRSDEIVEGAKFFDTLADALAGASYVVGTTARTRTAGVNYGRPRELAPTLLAEAERGDVAIVFGPEDRGLSNEALDLCHSVAVVPTDAAFSSLNLAQAALVVMYELWMATEGAQPALPRGRRATEAATHAELEQMYAALEGGLEAIAFFKARKPEAVMRTLRKVLGQARMDGREARLLSAVGYETGHVIGRLRPSNEGHPSCIEGSGSDPRQTEEPPPES